MLSFREQVIAFARTALEKAPQCHNEECTKQYLVLPFLRLLGYDPDNPNHVVAEHSADYSEKYRNRAVEVGRKLVAVGLSRLRASITDKAELADELAFIGEMLAEEAEALAKDAVN